MKTINNVKIINGWLDFTEHCLSPNFYSLADREVSLLVIHNISLPPGEFGNGYIKSLFTNQLNPSDHPYFETIYQLKVSSHLLISRDGEVTQFVSLNDCAHHAGESSFNGRARCNDFSIGIELEGTDDTPYTDEQYGSLSLVTNMLLASFTKLTKDRIVGHSDIAPNRKTDPGPAFDWVKFKNSLISSN